MLETETSRVADEVFNVSDVLTETREILSIVQQVTGSLHPLPPRAPNNIISEMDTARIRSLGWQGGGRTLLEDTVKALAQSLHHASEALSAPLSQSR
jgi:hypothetical protein